MNDKSLNFDIFRSDHVFETIDGELISKKNENSNEAYKNCLARIPIGNVVKYPHISIIYDKFIKTVTRHKDVIFGFGSDGILKDLFLALDYSSIQMLEYSYEMAKVYNQILSKRIIINPIGYGDKTFYIKNDIIKTGGDILYLVHPHCPSALLLSSDLIKKIAWQFKYVILDQAYEDPLYIDWCLYEIPNVIIVKSFSKLGGVPGLRLGYCLTSNGEVLKRLKVLRPLYEMSSPSVTFLSYLLDNKQWISMHIKALEEGFKEIKKYSTFSLHCSNFALLQPAFKFIGKHYDFDGEKFVRVTLTDKSNIKKLLV